MKKTLLQICSIIGFAIFLVVIPARAQTQYRAQIPFDFLIGQKTYKAGEYSVGLVSPFSDAKNIVIRDAKGRNSYMLLPTVSNSGPETAILVFNRYAGSDQYFLAEIKAPNFNAKLPKSKPEENAARGKKAQKETILLAKKN